MGRQQAVEEEIKGFAAVDLTLKRDLAVVQGKCEENINYAMSTAAGTRASLWYAATIGAGWSRSGFGDHNRILVTTRILVTMIEL